MEDFKFLTAHTEPNFAAHSDNPAYPPINPLVYYEYTPSINDLTEYMALMNATKKTRISKGDVERLQYVMNKLKGARPNYVGAGELFFVPIESSAKCYWVRFSEANFQENTITVEVAYARHSIDVMKKYTEFLSECMCVADVNHAWANVKTVDDALANYLQVMNFFSVPQNFDIPITFCGFTNSCEYDDSSHISYVLPLNILWKAMREEHLLDDSDKIFYHALQDA